MLQNHLIVAFIFAAMSVTSSSSSNDLEVDPNNADPKNKDPIPSFDRQTEPNITGIFGLNSQFRSTLAM